MTLAFFIIAALCGASGLAAGFFIAEGFYKHGTYVDEDENKRIDRML